MCYLSLIIETSTSRTKNTVNILIKNMLDAFIGAVSYWAIGWGLAYGANGNPFCGGSQFFNFELSYDEYPKWFFQVLTSGGYSISKIHFVGIKSFMFLNYAVHVHYCQS